MGLEGVSELVRAGVADGAGHLANAAVRFAEQLLRLRHPELSQVLVKGYA
jgi:hypothetical protein